MYGYGGLNYWDFVNEVGIKVVSIYYYFESKVDFGVVVVRCYWEDLVVVLDDMLVWLCDLLDCLCCYLGIFCKVFEIGNCLCLCSFMVVEIDDLLEVVMKEVLVFVDVNVVWLSKVLFVVVVVGVWESK